MSIDTQQILGHLGEISPAEQQELYRGLLSVIPSNFASSELGSYLAHKPVREKTKAEEHFRANLSGSSALGSPTQRARDRLWLIVVSGFSVVLVGAFITLALGVFISPSQKRCQTRELILTTFTSVVGFLAGLFVPSPANRAESNDSKGNNN